MEQNLVLVGQAVGLLTILVIAASRIRKYVKPLRSFYVPNAVTAGAFALLLGPEVMGLIFKEGRFSEGLFGEDILAVWSVLPGLLINIVFAAILLGKKLPSVSTIWKKAAPQALFGVTISFGQYALGLLLALLVLVPVFGMSELSGALLEISFTGGHGTAAGLSSVMNEAGFSEGADLALGLATVGLLAGILVGTLLINYAVRSDKYTIAREQKVKRTDNYSIEKIRQDETGESFEKDQATSPLTMTIGAITLAILLGWILKESLVFVEVLITGGVKADSFIVGIPLFPFTIIGGAAMQIVMTMRGWAYLVPRDLVNQAAGFSLDLLIAAAIATLSLSAIGNNAAPFVLMAIVAICWSVFAFLYLAPKFYGKRWFEPGVGDFGQSSGTVASGFLLIDMSDPKYATGARESYGYKQLLYEPFFGGGLITALSIPLISSFGALPMFIASTLLTFIAMVFGIRLRNKNTS